MSVNCTWKLRHPVIWPARILPLLLSPPLKNTLCWSISLFGVGGNTDSVGKSFLSIENQADTQTEKDKQLNKCTHNKLNDGTAPPDVFQRWREKVVTDFLKTWFERWLSRQRPLPPSLPNLSSILVTHMVKPRTKFYQLSSDLHTGALASTYV